MTQVQSPSVLRSANSGPGYLRYPQHKIEMLPFKGQVTVKVGDQLLADSHKAILLTETGCSPVYYLPRDDVKFAALEEVGTSTYCPFKGKARYWCLAETEGGRPILWGYETPYDEVKGISSFVAFYSDRVDISIEQPV